MDKKGLIGIVIAIFLVGGLAGGFIGYFIPREEEKPTTGSFNAVIDGYFNEGEGWQYSDWQFTEYLLTDNDNLDCFNFFYVHLTPSSLYILVDFVSDITNDTIDEYLAVWIDTDNSQTIFYNDDGWNLDVGNPGHELLCFIPETKAINESLRIDVNLNPNIFLTTLNESEATVEFGFQSSMNAGQLHRIFEVEINRDSLSAFNATNFNIGFLGYGTVFIPLYFNSGFWGAPTLFSSDFYYSSFFFSEGYIKEAAFFKCGYGTGIYDLNNTP
ncbi:MAG: hypothetical protein KAT66_05695 [Candidatus Lokiarchaeota archaeon]|nr:hypothetical protein [Candidatus Lokiarchaeota archaeon]